MNNKGFRKLLIYKSQIGKLAVKELINTKFYAMVLISVILAGMFNLSPVISSLMSNVTIRSSGTISTISPLHVEGRYIKDTFNNTVVLRGVWKGQLADSCVGTWGDPFTWDENVVRASMQALKNWGINVINDFIWGDWWLEDKNTTLGGYPTSHHYRWVIKETLRLAQEYGLYFQIRLLSPICAEGRVNAPYAPYSSWTVDDFMNFWVDVATELKGYPNVIFTLYDEPTGDINVWFDAAERAINAIRAVGAEQLIVVHWAYCGSCMWMEQWVNEGRPLHNIVFSNHIYRVHGTFGFNPNSPVDIDYIRNFLARKPSNGYDGAAYKYITDMYNVPIWVSAIGAYAGYADDMEYVYFRNTLAVLNEWGLGYATYHCYATHLVWTLLEEYTPSHPPNRVGQALIDAIAGVPVPPIHQLTINSNLAGLQFTLDGTPRSTPYGPKPAFQGSHIVMMPSSIIVYSHTPLFGNTKIGGSGAGYYTYIYTAGPYIVNETVTVSTVNLYTIVAGNAKVALYDESGGNPNNPLTQSAEEACAANSWHSFDVPDIQISPGNYFLAIKIGTNGMLSGVSRTWFGKYRTHDYALAFPDPFGEVGGGTGAEYSVYIPLAPIQSSTYNFDHWEDGSTNPERTINLTTNVTLTATYELSL